MELRKDIPSKKYFWIGYLFRDMEKAKDGRSNSGVHPKVQNITQVPLDT